MVNLYISVCVWGCVCDRERVKEVVQKFCQFIDWSELCFSEGHR